MKQFGLSSTERIKSKKEFEQVYSNGEFLFSSSQKFKAVFFIQRNYGMSEIKTAFAVSSRCGNAAWRNRVKRLLRESFRLNKTEINTEVRQKNLKLIVVFSPNTINQTKNKKIFFKEVAPEVVNLINKIRAKL